MYLYHYNTTYVYIDNEDSFTIRGLKVLCPSLFDNTIVNISVTLVNQVYEKNELISKAKSIIQLVSIHYIPILISCVLSFIISYFLWVTDIRKQILVT